MKPKHVIAGTHWSNAMKGVHVEDDHLVVQLVHSVGGEIEHEVSIQRAMYVAHTTGLQDGYRFTYHYHSVFSDELQYDIENALRSGKLVRKEYDADKEVIAVPGKVTMRYDKKFDIVKHVVAEGYAVLDALSVIVYLYRLGIKDPSVLRKVGEIRPHLAATSISKAFELYKKYYE